MNITSSGIARICELNSKNQKLRIFVKGGGCAGLMYGFEFVDTIGPDDIEINYEGISIVVDWFSHQMLSSTTIDFEDTLTDRKLILSGLGGCDCLSAFKRK